MMKKNLSIPREKLIIVLDERANQLKQTARELAKGTKSIEEALDSMYQTDRKDYKEYVQGLRVSEKEEFLNEISESIFYESAFWWNFIESLEDPTLTSLLMSASEIAKICDTLPTDRFVTVLNSMPPEKVFRVFSDSDDKQKGEVLTYIEVNALKNLFACVCTFEYNEQKTFLSELERLVELKTSSNGEEVGENEKTDENNCSADESFAIDAKVLEAIAALEAKEQAEIVRKMSKKWINPVLDQVSDLLEFLYCLSETDTVKLMLNCNEEHFAELFQALSNVEVFEWKNVFITERFELLKLTKERKLQAKEVFTASDLVDVYCHLNETEEQEFVLYEVLADFEQEEEAKAELYKLFETGVRKYFDNKDVPVKDELLFLHFLVDQQQQGILKEMFTISDLVRIYSELADEEEKVFILDEVLTNSAEDEDNKTEIYKVFEDAIRNRSANTLSARVDDEMRFLHFLIRQDKHSDIKYIFELDPLVRVFCDGEREDKKYLLDEILPVLNQEEINLIGSYKEFYELIPIGENSVNFLEMQYEKAHADKASTGSILTAEIMRQMLSTIENKTTTEKLFLESFISLIPESER